MVMTQGQLVSTWQDARLFAVLAGVTWYFLRRTSRHAVLGTLIVGMAVYLPLHVGWGW